MRFVSLGAYIGLGEVAEVGSEMVNQLTRGGPLMSLGENTFRAFLIVGKPDSLASSLLPAKP